MYIDLGLIKRTYEKLRTYNKEISANNSYPPYSLITETKKTCYPYDDEHIESSNVGASVHFIIYPYWDIQLSEYYYNLK